MNIAILLAGGSGSRLGGGLPKQFIKVNGKRIIEYTLDTFDTCKLIDEIAVVCRADYLNEMRDIVAANRYGKVRHILPGGKERYDSSLAALALYSNDSDNLLFHDAVRPMVTHRIIGSCIEALQTYNAVGVAVPTTDTILQIDDNGCIINIPPRHTLRNAQTPQGFKRGVIRRAYDLALQDPNFITTDDCGVVLKYLPEEPIFIVDGDKTNIKITYPDDLLLMEKLTQQP